MALLANNSTIFLPALSSRDDALFLKPSLSKIYIFLQLKLETLPETLSK